MNTLLTQGAVFFQDSKNAVIFSSLIVFTLVIEEVFEAVVFRCPCENHLAYGLLFLLGPTFVLLVAGILLNPNTWWLCNVRRFKHQHDDADQNCPCKKSKQRFCRVLVLVIDILSKALISPTLWLILSFLQKTFFICAVFGPRIKTRNLEDTVVNVTGCGNFKPRSLNEEAELMAKSQTIGLVLSLSATFVTLCAFIGKCFFYRSKISLPNEKFYMRVEAMEAAKEFNKRAKQEAQKQGKKAVEEVFQEMENDQNNYLLLISKAARKLDKKYSNYYSSLQIKKEPRHTTEDQNENVIPRGVHCSFKDDYCRNTFFVVDGKINTTGRKAEIRATIESGDKEARRTHTQSGIARVCLRRAKSSVK
ncbi:calcium homeostasis modulator protein 5-like [Actinia tenebrosa]|uniref:Calcium homeostasis modulator protein 5-like n=1 Tax=Actinia tenebrosa TaxID=6105 RepID=A0A6P8I7B1_ACTTE|nr:calcium homeostasis modulator protein 5-like [Actinia tenebrosa]